MNDDILAGLTPSQLLAVQHIDGPLLMLAGPGSGKTRVVTHRIANLLQNGISAHQILALTFTNKAADEMRRRVQALAPYQPVWMGTFHRFCARLLRRYAEHIGLAPNYSIFDTDDSRRALKTVIAESEQELTHATPDAIANAISWAKNRLITPEQYQPRGVLGHLVMELYPKYQQYLLAANAVDFDDLLMHVATLLRQNPELRQDLDARYQYILVDEYQDTNLAQYAIVRSLSIDHPNLAVTGNPDQSIYGWRGANIKNILEFENDFPKVAVVRLEQNYRSTKSILSVAESLIAHNVQRKHKDLYTDNDVGKPVRLTHYASNRDEADQIANRIAHYIQTGHMSAGDIAIFYRTNALSRNFENAFRALNIPYQIINGHEFYQRKEVKDVIAYLRLINNPADNVAFNRIINTPTRGIGKTTIGRIAEHARRYHLPMLAAAREAKLIDSLNKRAVSKVLQFVEMYDRLVAQSDLPVEALMGHVHAETKYREKLQLSESEEDQERLANVDELLTAAREFDEQHNGDSPLEAFLEQSSLVADTDVMESDIDRVTMMTLHAAKGLEFPLVFIIAIEQGLIPHERSLENAMQIEEERRLLFVGITRAERELELSVANYRNFRGRNWPTVPSHFLGELPLSEMEIVKPTHAYPTHFGDDFDQQENCEFAQAGDDFEFDQTTDDDDYSQVESEADIGTKKQSSVDIHEMIMTGADLLENPRYRADPEQFVQGMQVLHPSYGEGSIVALSGKGKKRTAVVQFEHGRRETIRIWHSELRAIS